MIFTIINYSSEIDATAAYTRPPAALKTIWQKFWQFSNSYGDYHSLPPSRRRQFILQKEQQEQSATAESCL